MDKLIKYLLFIPIFFGPLAYAQSGQSLDSLQADTLPKLKIQIKAQQFGDEIVVRWAPTGPGAWLMGNQYGYRLDRYIRQAGESFNSNKYQTIAKQLVALDSLGFHRATESNPDNQYLLAMAECIHGEMTMANPNQGLANVLESSDDFYNRFAFALMSADLDGPAADAAGLRYTDKQVKNNQLYYYRISLLDQENQVVEQVACLVNTTNVVEIVPEISEIKSLEKAVILKWDRDAHQSHYSAYNVERSADGSTWQQLNEDPYVHALSRNEEYNPEITFTDSIINYTPYFYRIIGLTPFGTKSRSSVAVKGMARDKTPPLAVSKVKSTYTEESGMQVSWTLPESGTADIDRLIVGHSLYFTGPFVPIAEFGPTEFTQSVYHDQPDTYKINYYMVATVDTAGNMANSLIASTMIPDENPPTPPLGLHGIVDTTGVVVLTWDANSEIDIQGYQVYYGGAMRSNFTQITNGPITDTFFLDTLPVKTLTENVYYKVVAIDHRFNYSKFSPAIQLERPDVLPPSPPVFTGFEVDTDGVQLRWANSSSLDVVRHELFRKKHSTEWKKIYTYQDGQTKFTDKSTVPHTFYEYRIVAYDEKGQWTECPKTLNVRSKAKQFLIPVLSATKQEEGVLLEWVAVTLNAKIIIQKSVNNGPFISIKSIDQENQKYFDKKLRKEISYSYRIKIISPTSASSYSNAVSTQF